MTTSFSDSVRLTLDVPAAVRSGSTVPITLRVENTGERPVELMLRGRTIAFDVIVRRDDGAVVWQRLAQQMIPAILRLEMLEPRRALELRAEWPLSTSSGVPVGPGSYTIEGIVFTEGPELRTGAAIIQVVA